MTTQDHRDDLPEDFSVQASFRYVAFFDLLGDAVFQHRQAKMASDSFSMSRFARASVLAASLGIECAANCLLDSLSLSKLLLKDLDKLPPLSKIEACLRIKGADELDRGRAEVQQISELIKARNDHVHPKISTIPTEMGKPQDGGKDWIFPFNLEGEHWPHLKIPKRSVFWSSESSASTLRALSQFLRYVFIDLLKFTEDDFSELFRLRIEFANVRMPVVWDEIFGEFRHLVEDDIDLSFRRLST
jgi:hypothetical protein